MIALKLSLYNTKRLLRHKYLRVVFVALPLVIALLRAVMAENVSIRYAAILCPIVCILMICAALYAQWSVDAASGLIAGLISCPIPRRLVVISRIISGTSIFAVQMVIFCSILIARF